MKLKTILHPLVVSIREFKDKSKQRVYCNSEFSQRIEKLKNINQGKRCFIIGNGPSLKIEDLNALVDEDCFACNRIYGLYDKTKWRPKYYCSQDEKVLEMCIRDRYTPLLISFEKGIRPSGYVPSSLYTDTYGL